MYIYNDMIIYIYVYMLPDKSGSAAAKRSASTEGGILSTEERMRYAEAPIGAEGGRGGGQEREGGEEESAAMADPSTRRDPSLLTCTRDALVSSTGREDALSLCLLSSTPRETDSDTETLPSCTRRDTLVSSTGREDLLSSTGRETLASSTPRQAEADRGSERASSPTTQKGEREREDEDDAAFDRLLGQFTVTQVCPRCERKVTSGQRAHLGCCQGKVGKHGLEDEGHASQPWHALEGPSIRTPFFHKLARNITDKLLRTPQAPPPPPPPPPRIDLRMEETSQTSFSSATSNKALSAHVKPWGPPCIPCSFGSPCAATTVASHASLLHAQEEDGDKVGEGAECRVGGEAEGVGDGEGVVMVERIEGGDKGPAHWLWHEASRVSPRQLGCRPRLARDLKRVPEVYESSLCVHMLYFSHVVSRPLLLVPTTLSRSLSLSLSRSLARSHTHKIILI